MNRQDVEVLTLLFAIVSTIFWMVIGWRAMRAHERLANASEQVARKFGPANQP